MSNLLQVADLERAKLHDTFHSEVITGKSGGLAGGADIDSTTNAVTGQVQATLPKLLSQVGFAPALFDFTIGGALEVNDRSLAVFYENDGNWYSWGGALPKTIPANSSPSSTGGISVNAWNISTSAFMYRDYRGFKDELYSKTGVIDNGLPNQLGNSQIVDGIELLATASALKILPKKIIYVDAPPFSGNLGAALDAATMGSVLILGNSDYNICGKYRLDTVPFPAGNWIGNEVDSISIIGSGMPTMTTDKSRYISGSGTVIQGALINFADGFRCYNLGIDVGPWVVDNLNSGVWMEGFIPGTHKLNTAWDDFTRGGYIKDVHFGDIKVLMKDPAVGVVDTFKHSMLIEYIDGGSHGYLESVGGFYGVVIKSRNITPVGAIVSYTHDSASVYFKSDQYTQCYHYRGGKFLIGNSLTALPSPPVLFTSENGVELGDITFDVSAYNVTSVINEAATSGGGRMKDVFITNIDSRRSIGDAVVVPFHADNWLIGAHNIIDGDARGILVVNGSSGCHIADGKVDDMASDGYALSGGASHGTLRPSNCGGFGVNNDGLAYINPDRIVASNCASGSYNVMRQQSFTLINSWSNLPSPDNFQIFDNGSALIFSGRIGGSPTDSVALILPATRRPKKTLRFACVGYNGTTSVIIDVEVRSDGFVVVSNYSSISGALPRGLDLSPLNFNY